LEEREISYEDMVEVDLRIIPRVVQMRQAGTGCVVGYDRRVNQVAVNIDAAAKSAAEQIDSHDTEDQPENEADEKYVENGGNGLNQCVDDNLDSKRSTFNYITELRMSKAATRLDNARQINAL
jgi:hypothetical protein